VETRLSFASSLSYSPAPSPAPVLVFLSFLDENLSLKKPVILVLIPFSSILSSNLLPAADIFYSPLLMIDLIVVFAR
jgi:hypothetical protein